MQKRNQLFAPYPLGVIINKNKYEQDLPPEKTKRNEENTVSNKNNEPNLHKQSDPHFSRKIKVERLQQTDITIENLTHNQKQKMRKENTF